MSNFVVREGDVVNAVARLSQRGDREIVYSKSFLASLGGEAFEQRAAALCVLAHEVGHHVSGHDLGDRSAASSESAKEDRRKEELEADRFAGGAMFRLGFSRMATLNALRLFADERERNTHPALPRREVAMGKGWDDALLRSDARVPAEQRTVPKGLSIGVSFSEVVSLLGLPDRVNGDFALLDGLGTVAPARWLENVQQDANGNIWSGSPRAALELPFRRTIALSGAQMSYYKMGCWASFDKNGNLARVLFFGRDRSRYVDASGNFLTNSAGAFFFRAKVWQLEDLQIGMTIRELVAKRGAALRQVPGNSFTAYAWGAPSFLEAQVDLDGVVIALGLMGEAESWSSDANGNVW